VSLSCPKTFHFHLLFYFLSLSLSLSLYIPLSFQGSGSVNTFPRQPRIVGRVDFYAVRVVSMESRRLVFPRTSWIQVWILGWFVVF
jgi:hypothetical protein